MHVRSRPVLFRSGSVSEGGQNHEPGDSLSKQARPPTTHAIGLQARSGHILGKSQDCSETSRRTLLSIPSLSLCDCRWAILLSGLEIICRITRCRQRPRTWT